MKHIVQFSGGKDSTCMLLMMLEKGMQVDDIVFCDTGMEFPALYKHIDEVEKYIGRKITRLKAEHSYEYMMYCNKRKRGNYTDVVGYGWPTMRTRWCTKYFKVGLFQKYFEHKNCIIYIGIAADEPKRHENIANNIRHPLYEWGITEAQALSFCYAHKFYGGGIYKDFKRVSCWCCPLQSLKELRVLYHKYPDLWNRLKEMDSKSWNQFRADYSVQQLEEKFQREDYLRKISIPLFDVTKYL